MRTQKEYEAEISSLKTELNSTRSKYAYARRVAKEQGKIHGEVRVTPRGTFFRLLSDWLLDLDKIINSKLWK